MPKVKISDDVIFKQRIGRHLSCKPQLPWEYEHGHIVTINEEGDSVNVCWLQGYHSRNDDVPIKDIVAKSDGRCSLVTIGGWRGRSKVLQKIVEEGAE